MAKPTALELNTAIECGWRFGAWPGSDSYTLMPPMDSEPFQNDWAMIPSSIQVMVPNWVHSAERIAGC